MPILEHDEGREQFYRGLSELDPNTTLKVRRVLSRAQDIHPAEVVREVDYMVKMSSPSTRRMLNLKSEAIPDEHLAALPWEPVPRVSFDVTENMMNAGQPFA